jgi:glycosyltransferase involved in cell wall biosynthesis
VHTNGFKMHILGAWCRPEGSRVLWHLHDYPASRPVTAALLRSSAPRCAAIVTNSESVAQQTRGVTRGAVPVHAIHNAVDLDRFTPEGSTLDLDALAGMPQLAADGVRIGMLGTFARWKGHAVFLRALAEVAAPVPVRGYVIGDSIYETDASQLSQAEIRGIATRLQLGDKVAFTGRVADVRPRSALDIVVRQCRT